MDQTAATIKIDLPREVVAEIIMARLAAIHAPHSIRAHTAVPEIGEPLHGGIYAGLTIFDDASHALVLLPGENESVNWKDAGVWAGQQGGELPSRYDGLTLFKNLKHEFKPHWYWTAEPHASGPDYAWVQGFFFGYQLSYRKDYDYRARAVRRYSI